MQHTSYYSNIGLPVPNFQNNGQPGNFQNNGQTGNFQNNGQTGIPIEADYDPAQRIAGI